MGLAFSVGGHHLVCPRTSNRHVPWPLASDEESIRSGIQHVLVMTSLCLAVFLVPFPSRGIFSALGVVLEALIVLLWFAGAFALRNEVARYHSNREALPFRLNPALTALFGPWYIGGHLRADFPLDEMGNAGSGVSKADRLDLLKSPAGSRHRQANFSILTRFSS